MKNLAARLGLRRKCLSRFARICLCLGSVIATVVGSVACAYPCELDESSSAEQEVFRRHLVGSCTSTEREALAISADEIFRALQDGKSLDLQGVIIAGHLMLDQLPLQRMESVSLSSDAVQRILAEHNIQNGRIIQGSLSIRDTEVQGNWATNLRKEVLIVVGEVLITGTTFQRSIDFSQTWFQKTVNFSNSVILYEGFFIRAHFEDQAIFDRVTFGTHSRFHKARFKQDVSFLDSRFNGLAEFLEVTFEKNASFTKVQFHMGTGFSGTHFNGSSNFGEALFIREAFFRHATFRQAASFRNATFHEVSDFTNAQFLGSTDFARVEFLIPPNFSGTSLEESLQSSESVQSVVIQIGIMVALLMALVFFIVGLRKR